jgi:hypothetical protein
MMTEEQKNRLNLLSTVVPVLLTILGYALEVEIGEGENAKLNTARQVYPPPLYLALAIICK